MRVAPLNEDGQWGSVRRLAQRGFEQPKLSCVASQFPALGAKSWLWRKNLQGARRTVTTSCTWTENWHLWCALHTGFLCMLRPVTSSHPSHTRDHLQRACSQLPRPSPSPCSFPFDTLPARVHVVPPLTLECWESGNSQAILSNNYFSRTRVKNFLCEEVTWLKRVGICSMQRWQGPGVLRPEQGCHPLPARWPAVAEHETHGRPAAASLLTFDTTWRNVS